MEEGRCGREGGGSAGISLGELGNQSWSSRGQWRARRGASAVTTPVRAEGPGAVVCVLCWFPGNHLPTSVPPGFRPTSAPPPSSSRLFSRATDRVMTSIASLQHGTPSRIMSASTPAAPHSPLQVESFMTAKGAVFGWSAFFFSYHPNNMMLVLAGTVKHLVITPGVANPWPWRRIWFRSGEEADHQAKRRLSRAYS